MITARACDHPSEVLLPYLPYSQSGRVREACCAHGANEVSLSPRERRNPENTDDVCEVGANEASRSPRERKNPGNPDEMCKDVAKVPLRSPHNRIDSGNLGKMCRDVANVPSRSLRLRTAPRDPSQRYARWGERSTSFAPCHTNAAFQPQGGPAVEIRVIITMAFSAICFTDVRRTDHEKAYDCIYAVSRYGGGEHQRLFCSCRGDDR